MAEWTQEYARREIAAEQKRLTGLGEYAEVPICVGWLHNVLDLAVRGLAAEQDAVKARALEEWVALEREPSEAYYSAEHSRKRAACIMRAVALCPTKETAT